MKKKGSLIIVLGMLVILGTVVTTYATQFIVSAQVPASNGVDFNVSKVTGQTFEAQAPGFTDLDFEDLELDGQLGIFLPRHFWVIDVAPNGAGDPDVDITYADTSNPAGVAIGDGLNDHGTLSWTKIFGDPEQQLLIDGKSLGEASGETVLKATFSGGFLRFAVGIATGDVNLPEGNAVPFTAQDEAGDYIGTLTLTASFNP